MLGFLFLQKSGHSSFLCSRHATRMCYVTEFSESISQKQGFVTIGGECFQLAPQGNREAFNRDGQLYKFHVTDCKKDRGKRLVSVFVVFSNSEQSDAQEHVDIACLNTIRRAFDCGELSFDAPYEQSTYKELRLDRSGFAPHKKVTDNQILPFVKNTAYWLGFHLSSNVDRYFVQFDLRQDLDYLGASSDDIKRSLWRLEREGLLEKSGIPGNFTPPLTLVEKSESTATSKHDEARESLLESATPGNAQPISKAKGSLQAMGSQQRPPEELKIFISHSSEDKPIAAALTELLKNALGIAPDAIRCTSVDGHRLSVGAKTDETLKRELLNARSFIALLTEQSLNSTWVLFELGARWGADHHLAPVFAAGLTAERLHRPLPR